MLKDETRVKSRKRPTSVPHIERSSLYLLCGHLLVQLDLLDMLMVLESGNRALWEVDTAKRSSVRTGSRGQHQTEAWGYVLREPLDQDEGTADSASLLLGMLLCAVHERINPTVRGWARRGERIPGRAAHASICSGVASGLQRTWRKKPMSDAAYLQTAKQSRPGTHKVGRHFGFCTDVSMKLCRDAVGLDESRILCFWEDEADQTGWAPLIRRSRMDPSVRR